jgi:hypothetical protein
MQLWVAALLFVLFASASAFSFLKAGKRNNSVRIFTGIFFALLGALALTYTAATFFFVASVE